MPSKQGKKAELYSSYPLSSVLIYNGSTVIHYLLGGMGLAIGYDFWSPTSTLLGFLYFLLSLGEMYIFMPMKVCPNCVYCRLKDSLCISGLNVISKKMGWKGKAEHFPKRAKGRFSPNNLYLASLIFPVIAMIPALIVNFSAILAFILLALIGLLLFRFLVILPKIACLHCLAKYKCPQAEMMGVRDL